MTKRERHKRISENLSIMYLGNGKMRTCSAIRNEQPLDITCCLRQLDSWTLELPPWSCRMTRTCVFDSRFNNIQQIRPLRRALKWEILKIDHVSMVRVCRTVIHFFTAQIWKDALLIPRVLFNQPVHFCQRGSHAFGVRIVKRE